MDRIKELVLNVQEEFNTLISFINENNSRPKIIIETMVQSLEVTDKRLHMSYINTSRIELDQLPEIIKRRVDIRDRFAMLAYPGKIRITIERTDE